MGCGCKNKQQTSPENQKQQQEAVQKMILQKNAELKETVKKTVEKYYNANKANNTNGWIKE
jgi:hypothetical protein